MLIFPTILVDFAKIDTYQILLAGLFCKNQYFGLKIETISQKYIQMLV